MGVSGITLLAALVAIICPLKGLGATAEEAGTIAVVSGKAWVRHGDVIIDGSRKPEVRYHDNYEKELGPNDTVMANDVIITHDDSYLKIYFRDDSIMDIGPNSTFKVQQFKQSGLLRNISFQLLMGKVRTLVTRALTLGSTYQVATPVSTMGVRGTEWVTHAYMDQGTYKTDITVLEGKVVVDVPKVDASGKASMKQVTITPGNSFSGSGLKGTVLKFNVSKLSPPKMERMIALVPTIGTTAGAVSTLPPPTARALPGTGLAMNAPPRPQDQNRKLASIAGAPAGAPDAMAPGSFTPPPVANVQPPALPPMPPNINAVKPMINQQPAIMNAFTQAGKAPPIGGLMPGALPPPPPPPGGALPPL